MRGQSITLQEMDELAVQFDVMVFPQENVYRRQDAEPVLAGHLRTGDLWCPECKKQHKNFRLGSVQPQWWEAHCTLCSSKRKNPKQGKLNQYATTYWRVKRRNQEWERVHGQDPGLYPRKCDGDDSMRS